MDIISQLTSEFSLKEIQVKNTVDLLEEGNTVPFIARYRKEKTGSLDDQTIRELSERLSYLKNFNARKEEIKELIRQQDKLTDEIVSMLEGAKTLSELEDIYRPYRPKRKTRASVAIAAGLAPLAEIIKAQDKTESEISLIAKDYINENVEDEQKALQGALDIISQEIADDANLRKLIREFMFKRGVLETKGDSEDSVYAMYNDFKEPVFKIAPHRVLAINRGEKEDFIKVNITIDYEQLKGIILRKVVNNNSKCENLITACVDDALNRLALPSVEREIRNDLTETASNQAIKVFGINLKQLLMQPPIEGKTVMGYDPSYRTGCKICVVDKTGRVLYTGVIYSTPPRNEIEKSKELVLKLIDKYDIDLIAIGNGTASKESEIFISNTIKECKKEVNYMMVSEAGASVYSASELGAKEFPDYDVSLRSAVSIARRIQDPLAELVKIDPKSIGVGQYQHDMKQSTLSESLDGVVESCVNAVGVDVNTASPSLLMYVAGLNKTVANNVVKYREENGEYKSRAQLKKVPKLGDKAFLQCAGFLRVKGSDNPLDNSSVHPESYKVAKELIKFCGFDLSDIGSHKMSELDLKVKEITIDVLAKKLDVGKQTLEDIISELIKPGRDPRDELPKPILRSDVMDINDLREGMEFTGTVRNVIDFGAFVDIGVHQDGLVHISQICDKYIKHPLDAISVGDIVKVKILSVDVAKKRISLTMKL